MEAIHTHEYPDAPLSPSTRELIARGREIRAMGGEAYVAAQRQEHLEDQQGQGHETSYGSVEAELEETPAAPADAEVADNRPDSERSAARTVIGSARIPYTPGSTGADQAISYTPRYQRGSNARERAERDSDEAWVKAQARLKGGRGL